MRHTISVIVDNKFGVLARVSGLFSSRGYNIDSLAVGETHDPEVSRMTIVVNGDDRVLDQVIKQLDKIVDVIEVKDYPEGSYVDRELMMIKISCEKGTRAEVLDLANIFRGRAVDIGHKTVILMITGDENKLNAFIELVEPYGILEVARTGRVAMMREINGENPLGDVLD